MIRPAALAPLLMQGERGRFVTALGEQGEALPVRPGPGHLSQFQMARRNGLPGLGKNIFQLRGQRVNVADAGAVLGVMFCSAFFWNSTKSKYNRDLWPRPLC